MNLPFRSPSVKSSLIFCKSFNAATSWLRGALAYSDSLSTSHYFPDSPRISPPLNYFSNMAVPPSPPKRPLCRRRQKIASDGLNPVVTRSDCFQSTFPTVLALPNLSFNIILSDPQARRYSRAATGSPPLSACVPQPSCYLEIFLIFFHRNFLNKVLSPALFR